MKSSINVYFKNLSMLLASPGSFFSVSLCRETPAGAFWFLLISGIVFTSLTLFMNPDSRVPLTAGILLLNALGMTLIASVVGYGVMVMTLGKRISFLRFFTIHAFASGVTLLAAWIPFFIIITEPWRWWLVGIGLIKAGSLGKLQAFFNVVLSISIITLFFWSCLPVLSSVSGGGPL